MKARDELSVAIRYFAAAEEAAGKGEETLVFPTGATLGDVKSTLVDRYGELMKRVVESGSFLIDGVVRRDSGFRIGGRVDVLPPFAGG